MFTSLHLLARRVSTLHVAFIRTRSEPPKHAHILSQVTGNHALPSARVAKDSKSGKKTFLHTRLDVSSSVFLHLPLHSEQATLSVCCPGNGTGRRGGGERGCIIRSMGMRERRRHHHQCICRQDIGPHVRKRAYIMCSRSDMPVLNLSSELCALNKQITIDTDIDSFSVGYRNN